VKNILIIGGTRNIGYQLTQRLLQEKHQITLLNRGKTEDDFSESVFRLQADRSNPQQLRRALLAKKFDVVIDFVMMKAPEAQHTLELLRDQVGHYIFISSGQVYLVREGAERPYKESNYEGRVMPEPKRNTYAYEEWLYGMDKRSAEDVFRQANDFPYTSLRLPMVNSERDHMRRLYQYVIRLKDGQPLLVPETPDHPLRHVYGQDVASCILNLIQTGQGKGKAYNISQDETVSLDEFLKLLAEAMGIPMPPLVRVKQSELEASGFLPDCSPFSDRWMSELDNTLSKEELGMQYTPLADYLKNIARAYAENPPPVPTTYKRRHAEVQFATQKMT
jgi:nucleoside-diphosphate-sugar epimerase